MSEEMTEHEKNVRALENEAREAGRERGWNHANFVDAYNPYRGKPFELYIPNRFIALESFFRSGFEEGIDNFKEGLYADGTPIE